MIIAIEKTRRSQEKPRTVCAIGRFMDLFDKDVQDLTKREGSRCVCRELLLKYRFLSRTQWIYVLGRLVCSAYTRDPRNIPSREACEFGRMLDLFHADIHETGLMGQEEADLDDVFEKVWADCKDLMFADRIAALGELVFFFYHNDPRVGPSEKVTA
jgi:hypothetical protein